MRNFKNNKRRFRSNSFERNLKISSGDQNINAFGNISDFKKKSFSRGNFNSSKLIQKYSDLSREALSNGDKILYENYLQHAEHFIRVTENGSNNTNNNGNKNVSSNNAPEANIRKISEENNKKDEVLKSDKN